MTTPYFNANGIPVVKGSFVSSSNGNPTNFNHSINDKHIADAMTRKQQQDVDARMSYYEASNYDGKRTPMNVESNKGDGTIPRGEIQHTACRDSFWAILFYAHLVGMVIATVKYVPMMTADMANQYAGGGRFLALRDGWFSWEGGNDSSDYRYLEEEDSADLDMSTILTILLTAGIAGFSLSTLAMSLMMAAPVTMIKIALALNLVVTAAVCVFAMVVGAVGVAIVAGIGLLLTIYYTYVFWKRIPFAASTLVTALTAVKCNMGLAFFAYNNLLLNFLWALWWTIAVVATFYVLGDCNAEGYCENEIQRPLVFLFLLSFYWTAQIIKNVVHVTVAGTVGTWWFVPGEAKSCCSSAVRNSYWRAVTTSFGSICFGSLLVAIIQAVREIVHSMRNEEEFSFLVCLIDCILGLLERIMEYFNKWAYIYVGLYGYGFIEASLSVVQLFKARGWTAIIADYLVDTVLLMVSICVGILTGAIGALVGNVMQQDGTVVAGAFVVGAMTGFILCSTLFGLVSSAVNTVIVCFAEAPAEFQANHPQLSQQMVLAWRDAYPDEFGY